MAKHPTEFTQEEFDQEQERRRYYFARFCWLNKDKYHKCKDGELRSWPTIFSTIEGINFYEFIKPYKDAKKKKRTQSSQRSLWETS